VVLDAILLLPRLHAKQLTAISTWFIWRGSIFKVPVTTLQLPKWLGWDLPHIETKCKALLYNRLQMTGAKPGRALLLFMHKWALDGPISNPPAAHGFPTALNYLQQFAIDMAYIPPHQPREARKAYKHRIYDTLHYMANNDAEPCSLRIVKKCPNAEWGRVWKNLHSRALSDYLTSTWYVTVHDIFPINDRLAAIHLTPTSTCPNCRQEDSIQHRITDCGKGPVIWNWTQMKLGMILCVSPNYIPKDWTIHPAFTFWPPQRHATILWILANLVHYRLQTHRQLSLSDFMDFLRTSHWKSCPGAGTISPMGRYLEVLGWMLQWISAWNRLPCLEESRLNQQLHITEPRGCIPRDYLPLKTNKHAHVLLKPQSTKVM